MVFQTKEQETMLSRLQDELNKPYYFFRPSQVLLRLQRKLAGYKPASSNEQVILPWGLSIQVHPTDLIGNAIYRAGVYDLCVSEVLWRLLNEGETAVDAGANIGQMTSIMAKRVGNEGQVLSFEPHPQVFQELAANVAAWQHDPGVGQIKVHEMGLSKEAGFATLHTTSDFAQNRGTASLEVDSDENNQDGKVYSVVIERLENVVPVNSSIGVMKLDVEGHEIDLLLGASRLLTDKRIRDIVFEEHNSYPSPVTDYLEQQGYTIFSIEQGPLSLRVSPARQNSAHYRYEAQSYLATLDAPRTLKRLNKWGYQALQAHKTISQDSVATCITIGALLLSAAWLLSNKGKMK